MCRSLRSRRFLMGKTLQTTCLKRKCESVCEVTLLCISVALQHSMSAKVEYKTYMNVWQNNRAARHMGVKLKWFYKMSFAAWTLPTGRQELFYSEERCRGKNTVFSCRPVCFSLPAFPPLSNEHRCSHITLMVNFIRVNESHRCDAFISLQNIPRCVGCSAVTLGRLTGAPCRSPWGYEFTVQTLCYTDKTAAALLSYTVCLPNVHSRTYSNKSRRKNKCRGWRERRKWRSQCFHTFKFTDMMTDREV